MKIETAYVEEILNQRIKDKKEVSQIMSDLNKVIEQEREENAAAKVPKQKSEYFLVASQEVFDHYKLGNVDVHLVKVKEGFEYNRLQGLMDFACAEYKKGKKAKKHPIKNLADMCSLLKKKMFGETEVNKPSFVGGEPIKIVALRNSNIHQ